MKAKFKVKFTLKDTDQLLSELDLQPGGKVQTIIDKSFLEACDKYIPENTGSMKDRSKTATVCGSGRVVFPGPYAHYQYYGEVYGPNIPIFDDDTGIPTTFRSKKGQKKHPTGRELQYSKDPNPNACSHWAEVAKANHMKDIMEEIHKATGYKVE